MAFSKGLAKTGYTVQRIKIFSAYSAAKKVYGSYTSFGSYNVDGYEWVVRYYPHHSDLCKDWLAFRLLCRQRCENGVKAALQCRFVDETGTLPLFGDQCVTCRFVDAMDPGPPLLLLTHEELLKLGYLRNDSIVVECTTSVLRSPDDEVANRAAGSSGLLVPSSTSSLHQQLGELLHTQRGEDVEFVVSGESLMAHKIMLAARSPIFMAEFFGPMKESSSDVVEIRGVEPEAFKAMLHFIYTDTCPDFFAHQYSSDLAAREEVTALAQHLLAAADRYGLDRLKLTTLALADQLHCSRLKKRCIQFILASLENLDAVMATQGYKHLMASCPLVVNDLLRAVINMCYY